MWVWLPLEFTPAAGNDDRLGGGGWEARVLWCPNDHSWVLHSVQFFKASF